MKTRHQLILLAGIASIFSSLMFLPNETQSQENSETMKDILRALHCMKRTPEEIQFSIEAGKTAHLYEPKEGEPNYLFKFKINLPKDEMHDVVMSIKSLKIDKNVYFGPYLPAFEVRAGKELLKVGGMDIFKFVFYSKKEGIVCVSEQETGGRLWRTDVPAEIEFLPWRQLDEKTQTPIAWRVR